MTTVSRNRTQRIKLTPAQQDYVEACYLLEQRAAEESAEGERRAEEHGGVRVTDIAHELGTRLPTVTRSMARLKRLGLIRQEARGPVQLTPHGRALAEQLAHRHRDVMRLLTQVLGVDAARAEDEACLLEHGLSGQSAQRLHEFLVRWDSLPNKTRDRLRGAFEPPRVTEFTLVGGAAGAGRRR